MQTDDKEEAVRNQRQYQQHKSRDKLVEEQRVGKYSNIAPNSSHNHITNNGSFGHMHDNPMGNLVVMTTEQVQRDTVKML